MLLLIQFFNIFYYFILLSFTLVAITSISTHFTDGGACGTYSTFGNPVPVGTCIHSGVILLACSVY